jgi:hypothetical protein
MYNVVFRRLGDGTHQGVVTWSSYDSKEHFDKCYTDERRLKEEVVEEGVSTERALELCSTPEAAQGTIAALERERDSAYDEVDRQIDVLLDLL